MHVTHLECSLTGERYHAGRIAQFVARRAAAAGALRPGRRRATLMPRRWPAPGRHVEMARTAAASRGAEPVSLGETERRWCACSHAARRAESAGQGRGPPADRIVQGARARDGGQHGQAFRGRPIAMPTNGNAGAALAAYGAAAGIKTIVICPAETPEINIPRPLPTARMSMSPTARSTSAAAGRQGRRGGPLVRLLDAEGALSARRQEGHGARARRAIGLAIARRDLLPDGRRHRPDRHVEGLRRAGGDRTDRAGAAADVRGPGRWLRADRAGV